MYSDEVYERVDSILSDFGYDDAGRMIVLGGLRLHGRIQGVQKEHRESVKLAIDQALKSSEVLLRPAIPVVGSRYRDVDGTERGNGIVVPWVGGSRTLTITEVAVGDPLGREVRGYVSKPETNGHKIEYATTMSMFSDYWRPEQPDTIARIERVQGDLK